MSNYLVFNVLNNDIIRFNIIGSWFLAQLLYLI